MRTLISLFICMVFGLNVFQTKADSDQPNIIFMMADDLGYDDVGFNGNKLVKTPNLDKMAGEGMRFTQFYSVGPVCAPTRACVQTGRHNMRFGMVNVNVGKLPKGEINLPKIAKEKGYVTGHFGKWHLGTLTKDPKLSGPSPKTTAQRFAPPWERNYDESFVTETNVATWDPLNEKGLRIPKHRAHFWENGELVKEDFKGSSEKIIVDRALKFIRKAAENKSPFMTTVWFYGPHSPTRAGKELRDLYPNEPLGRQHYLGSITSIDIEAGRILNTLEELNIADNTLIFFCSDNGPEGSGKVKPGNDSYKSTYYGSAGEFKGRKRDLYNGGVCVPAFAYWPGKIKSGTVANQAVCTLDYLPTMNAILDYKMPDERPIDGVSFLPLLKGESWTRKKFIPLASNVTKSSPELAIIHQNHKLMIWSGKKGNVLYDLKTDFNEKNNIIKKKPELAERLQKELDAWLKSVRYSYETGDYPGYIKQGSFISNKKFSQ